MTFFFFFCEHNLRHSFLKASVSIDITAHLNIKFTVRCLKKLSSHTYFFFRNKGTMWNIWISSSSVHTHLLVWKRRLLRTMFENLEENCATSNTSFWPLTILLPECCMQVNEENKRTFLRWSHFHATSLRILTIIKNPSKFQLKQRIISMNDMSPSCPSV